MKLMKLPSLLIVLLAVMTSCLSDQASDYEKIVNRDTRLLKAYLERNGIDAIENPLGYFYQKAESNDVGNQIVNKDILGIYYEIKTIDGQLIDSYLDETKLPRIFLHDEGGLVPRVMNFSSGLGKEGETFIIYAPSFLAYQEYSFQQLILPNSNLEIKIKYASILSEEEVEDLEDSLIQAYLEEQGKIGFERTEEGLYVKITDESATDAKVAAVDDIVAFEFELTQMGSETVISKTNANSPLQVKVGDQGNLDFLNLILKDSKAGMKIEVFSPSQLAFGTTAQVFPFQIRQDLFNKGALNSVARPFEPIFFKTTIKEVK
ncbi:FKBP-type peptidyl-prolyl cis-trans isomerase [Belliella aquatica]|uniref:peptidylprolyl isomerase n=1 Tax=Belliella aquatica TaxID=1323734 RepID=A0ABQ1MKU3_9BACT|nr:peptidylprolyl isomerase [Belliella aquatica]MCH7405358.1 peptidylprolyl isomerase [Belliella aquatica]GGC42250.1 hypothetical protein GCM10010993_21070 [Belliella aquatica]